LSLVPPTPSTYQDPHKFLAMIAGGRETFDVPQNSHIYSQGDRADSVYFIQRGGIKVTVTSNHGKQATVAILKAGQFFGEGCLGGQTYRMATTTALAPCRITLIKKIAMNETLEAQPTFAKFFMDHLLSRNSRIEEDVVDLLFNPSEKRLARVLLLLAQYGNADSSRIIPVTMKQEVLAEMIGTTRSRVSFFMNRFREKGLISYEANSEIVVHVSLLAAVLHDHPQLNEARNDDW
jgi:CRP/FNR family transcriptional regulator, cyclic AMP receptor protein